jgi:hypothetical protein
MGSRAPVRILARRLDHIRSRDRPVRRGRTGEPGRASLRRREVDSSGLNHLERQVSLGVRIREPVDAATPQAAREREQVLAVNSLLLSLGREVRTGGSGEDPSASLLRRLELWRGAISLGDADRHLRAVARVRYDWVGKVGNAVVAHAGGVLVGVRDEVLGRTGRTPLAVARARSRRGCGRAAAGGDEQRDGDDRCCRLDGSPDEMHDYGLL